jgi:hypothetical protein
MLFIKISVLVIALPLATAWPGVMEMNDEVPEYIEPPYRGPAFKSGRPNTSLPPVGFDAAEQYVNVKSGSGHEWESPKSGDIRGPCPGLNAAANHGFIPRNGLLTIKQSEQYVPKRRVRVY